MSGWENKNDQFKSALRSVGKQIIARIGRSILQGKLNLTKISFPIKAMIPESALQKSLNSTLLFPLYLNKAAHLEDKIERMKLVITACIANFHYNQGYAKPLNPILGETCEASYEDGTKLYAEQISHHPPVCYLFVEPSDKSYQFYGSYNYSSKAGLNSLSLVNSGKRNVMFRKDKQLITYNFAQEMYSGLFWGAMKLETKGQILFEDKENKIEAAVWFEKSFSEQEFGDQFIGEIRKDNKVVSEIKGCYLTHIDFDGFRYFDYRSIRPYKMIVEDNSILESDQCYRLDKLKLLRGDTQEAQQAKEDLENI